ncbi:MAG: hypothetical protein IK025_10845 [Bacteroidales bacterium]|nr:hypothetical protein [Bacteroidales bacterium]
MRNLLKLFVLAIIAVGCILPSCTKDNFDMDRLSGEVAYDGSFAIPLAYSDVSFYQILNIMDTSIALQDNEDGYLSMFYHSYVESRRVQDLLNLSPQHYETTINLSDMQTKGVRAGSQLYYDTEEIISFTLMNEETENNEAEIDSLALNAGTLEYTIGSTFGLASKVVVEFPSIKRGGRPLKDSIALYSTDSYDRRTLSLAGYTIDLTTTSRHYNEIPVKIRTLLDYGSSMPTMGTFSVGIDIRDFNYKGMYGFFGKNKLLIQSDTIEVTMFKENPKYDWEHAQFFFKNPKITVKYWNSYGIPSRLYFTEFDAHLQQGDIIKDMSFIAGDNGNFPFAPPSYENPELARLGHPLDLVSSSVPGREAEGEVFADATNSNINRIVPSRPTWIHFAAKAETNPEQHGWNFIDENSKLRAKVEIEIPLYGHLYNFTYRDTADIDISSYVGNLPVKRMAILLNVRNNMPVRASAQFYLVDEYYNVIDSIIKTPNAMVLEAAEVDANGRLMTNEPASAITKIELTREQISSLSNSRHLLTKFTVNTAGDASGGQDVKLFREYGFKANLGLDFDLDVEANINGK